MNLKIHNRKLFMDGQYYCDSSEPTIPNGKYTIKFEHAERFNSMMPIIDVPDYPDVMFCWCQEKCNRELSCEFCNAVCVGRLSLSGELLQGRGTFNQLYDKIRHPRGKNKKVTLEIN